MQHHLRVRAYKTQSQMTVMVSHCEINYKFIYLFEFMAIIYYELLFFLSLCYH